MLLLNINDFSNTSEGTVNDISMGMITSALADRIRIQSDLDKLENGLKSKRRNSIETSAHTNERKNKYSNARIGIAC